jgi:hypothetical protein
MQTGDKYRTTKDGRFLTGGTTFSVKAGFVVTVRQIDQVNKKVLIDFGSRMVDWFSPGLLAECFEKIEPATEPQSH